EEPRGILVSLGPGAPQDSGISLQTVLELGPTIPIFGVCMGKIICAPSGVMHGKSSPVYYDEELGKALFNDLPKYGLIPLALLSRNQIFRDGNIYHFTYKTSVRIQCQLHNSVYGTYSRVKPSESTPPWHPLLPWKALLLPRGTTAWSLSKKPSHMIALEAAAWTDDGLIMAARHKKYKHIQGVQFHPENIITPEGKKIILNFVRFIEELEKQRS
ncbi:Anthranilate synthase beta subunit 2, chloroplastic, partial [Zea mays]